jgi:hypothetical protein
MRLAENSGIAFIGCYTLGMGFVIESDEAVTWIVHDPRNSEVLFPYLNGDDVNSRPDSSPSRWVIDFYDRSLAAASTWSLPMRRLTEQVRDERMKVNRKVLRDRWWQHAEKRPAMRRAVAGLKEVLVITRHSKSVMPVRVPNNLVPSEALVVFATDSYAQQAWLSSSLHQMWAIKYGSTLGTGVRYTPSDVFETFPRPAVTDRLDAVGRELDAQRRAIMSRRGLGLTRLYNLINDPAIADSADADVARLRRIHIELDEAVMAAYGWDDVPLEHGFYTYRQMERWTVSPAARVEILDRLLEENHRRAALQSDVVQARNDSEDDA